MWRRKKQGRKRRKKQASKPARYHWGRDFPVAGNRAGMCAGPPVKVHAHHCIHFRWSPPVKVKAHHFLKTKAVKAHQKDNGRQSGERIR